MLSNIFISYTEIFFDTREAAEAYAKSRNGYISKDYSGHYIVTIYN